MADLAATSTNLQVVECWLHYIDATHANIIENETGGGLGNLSATNVAGFNWAVNQNVIFTQNAVNNQHLVLYFMVADFFPKGII